MFLFKPLMAVDWIEIIIFLIIVVSSLIGQLFQSAKPKNKPPSKPGRGRPKPKPRPVQQPVPEMERMRPAAELQRGRGPVKAGPTALEQEIQEFLQRHRPAEAAAKPKPATPPPATTRRPPPSPGRKPPASTMPKPLKPRPAEREDFPPRESVEVHVERHLRQGGVGARDAHLGDQIEQSDERLESHLQEVFQHSLGQLDSTIAVQPGIAAGTDAGVWDQRATAHPLYDALTQMVSSPRQMQAAIVLSEIIRRPEERWS
jgi:hypothetical protein